MVGFWGKICRGLQHRMDFALEGCRYYCVYPFALVMKHLHPHIYLLSERGHDARDNGYYMYKYFREKHREKEVYYVISKDSADRKKVEPYGNLIDYGSLKHYLYFIASEYKISTHIMGYSPYMFFYSGFNERHRIPGKQIFLQHGIIQNDHPGLYKNAARTDLFLCGAEPEYQYVAENFCYNNEVKYTGLARFDGLQSFTVKKQILVMPTWRVFLSENSEKEFLNSQYFQCWNGLLNNPVLQSVLRQYGIRLIFYPHYELQKYLSLFTVDNKQIGIADFAHYDVQTLLKESALLVTDFSSVYFDFAYMGKPSLYYQFDEERFNKEQYPKGYFNYRTMGFGPVFTEEGALVDAMIQSIQKDFLMDPMYQSRISKFFPLHDGKNCDRIYTEIEALK